MSVDLTNPIFTNVDKAREYFEALHWPNGPVCPHCKAGGADIVKAKGKSHRPGLWHCIPCFRPFSVTVGTVMERSHIPLNKWALAFHLMAASKKGISAHQMHRMLDVTYRSAWFMAHRIREAMRDNDPSPMGGPGQPVQADETYFGKSDQPKVSKQRGDRPYKSGFRGTRDKQIVVGLVSGGKSRMFSVDHADKATVTAIVRENVNPQAELHTDESRLYRTVGKEMAAHRTVKHQDHKYVADDGAHTNTIEGYFSIFKRGMKGVYQHCDEKHLHRYLQEFDFRYSHRSANGIEDTQRAGIAIQNAVGKRLTYSGVKE